MTCMKMRKACLNNIQWLTSHIRRPLEMMSVACDLYQNTSEPHSDISMFLKYFKFWTLDIKKKKDIFSYPLHLQYVYFVCIYFLSHVWLFATPAAVPCQAPLSMGILQARILEWVATSSSRGSPQPRDWTQVAHITGGFFTIWATREALSMSTITV